MSKQPVKIVFAGDTCPHLRIEKLALDGNYTEIFQNIKKEFSENDLNVVDLECPLTIRTKEIEKTGPHQKAHPQTIHMLTELGIDIVAMANNHILDYGHEALLETMELCRKNNVTTIGVGKNLMEARQPVIKEIKGIKIGFLNFCENEWTIATSNGPGANPMDLIDNFNSIKQLKEKVDKIIVIAHGGVEFYHLPSPRIKKTFRYFVDAGADAVISHHTHCFSGYEVYKKAPIFYGLGNFIYDWPNKENTDWNAGYLVRLIIQNEIGFEIIPFKQNNTSQVGVHRLTKIEEEQFQKRLKLLNDIIADDLKLTHEFEIMCNNKAGIYKLYFEPYRGKILSALRIRKLLPDLFTKRKRMFQANIIRCESHRDIILKTFENHLNND